jgi:hypothetical protein
VVGQVTAWLLSPWSYSRGWRVHQLLTAQHGRPQGGAGQQALPMDLRQCERPLKYCLQCSLNRPSLSPWFAILIYNNLYVSHFQCF